MCMSMHWSVSPGHVLTLEAVIPLCQDSVYYLLVTSAFGCQPKQFYQSPGCCVNISRSALQSAHGNGWTLFMLRAGCSSVVIHQNPWKKKAALTFANRLCKFGQWSTGDMWIWWIMYVAVLLAKIMWPAYMGELVVIIYYCKMQPVGVMPLAFMIHFR